MKLSDMTIGVIGNGVVGQATARSYLEHVKEVRCWDTDPRRSTCEYDALLDCEIIFICLPTPSKEDGSCDISIIEGHIKSWGKSSRRLQNYVLKSTVPVGTTKYLSGYLPNLVHSPEFLTARCATLDAQIPSRNIIGIANGTFYGEGTIGGLLVNLYKTRFPHVPCLIMTSNESEAVKLVLNSFFSVKVAFWNQIKQLTDKLDLSWEIIRNAVLADGRVHPSHTMVPGQDCRPGFGGACLRKDLSNLLSCFKESGLVGELLEAAHNYNNLIRGKE
jgi:UDPglucose 6-dehydrogenase